MTTKAFPNLAKIMQTSGLGNTSLSTSTLGRTEIKEDVKGVRYDESKAGNVSTLAHLVDTDLKAAIRLVLDRNWTNSYKDLLSEHEHLQKRKIDKLCAKHYQDFVSSVESLVNVKYDITNLKQKIRDYNEKVQESGKSVISAVEKLMPQRHIRQRIEQALEVLQNCASRIESIKEAQRQIEEKRYVQALRTLARLQMVPHYSSRIAHLIDTVIKRLKAKIQVCVRREYDQWLSSLPQVSQQLGIILLSKSREQIRRARVVAMTTATATSSSTKNVRGGGAHGGNDDMVPTTQSGAASAKIGNEEGNATNQRLQLQQESSSSSSSSSFPSSSRTGRGSRFPINNKPVLFPKTGRGGEGGKDENLLIISPPSLDEEAFSSPSFTAVNYKGDVGGSSPSSSSSSSSLSRASASRTNFSRLTTKATTKASPSTLSSLLKRKNDRSSNEYKRRKGSRGDGGGGRSKNGEFIDTSTGNARGGNRRRRGGDLGPKIEHDQDGKEGGGLVGSAGLEVLLNDGLTANQAAFLLKVQDDLGIVYQTIYIYKILGEHHFSNLKDYTLISRKKQAMALAKALPANLSRLFKEKDKYFGGILGIFAIYLSIIRSPLGGELLSLEECHKLWSTVICPEIEQTAKLLFTSLKKPEAWKDLRSFTGVFVHALKSLTLPSTPLKAFLGSKQGEYQKLLEAQIDKVVNKILQTDRFDPLTVPAKDKFRTWVLDHGLEDPSTNHSGVRFPFTVPFSSSVPLICKAITSLMEDYFSFKLAEEEPSGGSGLDGDGGSFSDRKKSNQNHDSKKLLHNIGGQQAHKNTGGTTTKGDVDDPYYDLMALVDSILCRSVVSRLSPASIAKFNATTSSNSADDDPNDEERRRTTSSEEGYHGRGMQNRGKLPPSMVGQLLVNCHALADGACSKFEERAFRMVEKGYPRRTPPSAKADMKAKSMLEGLKMKYYEIVLEGIGARIDELLVMSSESWKSSKLEENAWPAFNDLVFLLEGSFASLTFLPTGLREGAHLHAFNHISLSIRGYWRKDLRGFTVVGLANFGKSLKILEDFARTLSNVPGAVETLGDLRQITDLILKESNITDVIDRKYRESAYSRVQTDLLCDVLSKYQSLSIFTRTPAGLPKHSKRDVEAVIKALREGSRID